MNALAGTPLTVVIRQVSANVTVWHVVAQSIAASIGVRCVHMDFRSEKFSETAAFSACGAWNRGYQQWVVQLLGPAVFGVGRT